MPSGGIEEKPSETKKKNSRNHVKIAKGSLGSSSSSSSEESLSTEDDSLLQMPTPPDGGVGWLIVFAAFMVNLISDGISFSFGILYTELLDYFGESKSYTSLIGSLFYGTCLMGGPLASALATKYGCRKVTIFGGLLATVGCFLSAFVDSVGMLCFCLGIVCGIGMSMGYVTSLVMVSFYFEKKRALATGLAVCGSGIGTFFIAPLTEYLLTVYNWRGTMVIWSGITLNLVVFGALFRPLEFTPSERKARLLKQFERMSRPGSFASMHHVTAASSRHGSSSDDLDSSDESSDEDFSHCYSQIEIPTFLNETSVSVPDEILREARTNKKVLNEYIKNFGMDMSLSVSSSRPKSTLVKTSKGSNKNHVETIAIDEETLEKEVKTGKTNAERVWKPQNKVQHVRINSYLPLYRKDIFFRGNLMRLFGPTGQIRSTSCPELYKTSWSDSDSSDDEDDCCIWRFFHFSKHIKRVMKTMFDPSILMHPLYMLFAISNFMLYFWYDVPYIFMGDRAIEHGVSEGQASIMFSVLGIVNTFGQILYGVLGDKAVNLNVLYGVSLMLCGASIAFVPMFTTHLPLTILAGLFGLFISANYALSTVILVDFLGLDKLSNAYGLTMLVQGIANLVGPPLGALLYDHTGSYDATFLMGGGFIAFAGMLLLFVPICRRCPGSHRTRESSITLTLSSPSNSGECVTDRETVATEEERKSEEAAAMLEKESVV